jgi:hypothetical protein
MDSLRTITPGQLADEIDRVVTGTSTWRVMNRDETAFCIQFDTRESMNPERECREWIDSQRKRSPGYIEANGYHAVGLIQFTDCERLAKEAAAAIRALNTRDAVTPAQLADQRGSRCASDTVVHRIKTDPDGFQAILDGRKKCDLRFNDRDYQVGQVLELLETRHTGVEMCAGAPLMYTGRTVRAMITHLFRDSVYGLDFGWVAMSIEVC